jgi:hypothetical protein
MLDRCVRYGVGERMPAACGESGLPRTGNRVRRWTVVLLAAAAVVAAGELGLRHLAGPPPGAPPTRTTLSSSSSRVIENPAELGGKNVRGLYAGASYETNAAGFRDREYALLKPPRTFRIVVMGDASTMGEGVEADDTYAAVFERMLAGRDDGLAYEVLNLGIVGLTLEQNLRSRLIPVGLAYAPDLIVYGSTLSDIEGPSYRRSSPGDGVRGSTPPPFSMLWERVAQSWRRLRDAFRPAVGSYVAELDDNYFGNAGAWEDFVASLDRLASVADAQDVCVLTLLIPRMQSLDSLHPFSRHYAAIANAAQAEGFYVVEAFPYFRGLRAESLWVSTSNRHPNRSAHELLAEALHDGFDRLPTSCWQRRENVVPKDANTARRD